MTELVPVDYNSLLTLAEQIARSPLMPAAYRGKPADAAIAMLYGSECGLPPMTSLQRIVVVNGRPGLDAQGMVALIRSRGHHITGEVSNDGAQVQGKRGDNGDELAVTFTIEDARQAGLVKNGPWTQYPSDMLWSKAVSRLGRRLFADVLMGFSYTDDEVESFVPQRKTADDNTISGLLTPVEHPVDAPVVVSTIRQPPTALRPPPVEVVEETGEIIEAEVVPEPTPEPIPVPDDANEKMRVLGEIVRTASNSTGLRAEIISRWGPASQIPPEHLQEVINFAAGWGATDPADEEPF